LHENPILRHLVMMAALVSWGLASWSVAAQKTSPPPGGKPPQPRETLAKVWVSETTHHEYRVRIEQDVFYAEWINLPPAADKLGAYIRTECHHTGAKWIGTTRIMLACAKPGETSDKLTRACPMTLRFEVDAITPERISGRGESLRDFDCEKCEVRQTGWGDFVWVPKH
jgi:hypothetical protein